MTRELLFHYHLPAGHGHQKRRSTGGSGLWLRRWVLANICEKNTRALPEISVTHKVYTDTQGVWDAMLNQTDLSGNQNKNK